MKSEHRHELAENDLEVLIGKIRAGYAIHKDRVRLYSAVAMLLLAAVIFSSRNSGSANSEGWAALQGAEEAADLAGLVDNYKGEPVGHWAQLRVGEEYTQSGLRLMFTDRESGNADLDEAQAAFSALLQEKKLSDAIKERALFGLARVQESTSGEDLKPAIQTYQKLLTQFPDTPYQSSVEARIETLGNKSTQEFYAWFAEQKPKPQDRTKPTDLQGLKGFEDLLSKDGTLITPQTSADEEGKAKEGEKEMTTKEEAKPKAASSVPAAPVLPPVAQDKKMTTKPDASAKEKAEAEKKTAKPAAAKKEEAKTAPAKPVVEKKAVEKKVTEKKESPQPEAKKTESEAK